MKKFMKLGIVMATVMAINSVSVFGAAAGSELTIKTAISKAVSNSSALKKLAIDEKANTETEEKNLTSYYESTAVTAAIDYQISMMQTNMSKAMNEQDTAKQKDLINYSVTQYFVTIVQAEADYKMYKQEMAQEKKNLAITEAKHKFGLISDADFETAKTSYNKKVDSAADHEKALSNAYKALNDLMGTPADTRYDLVYTTTYQSLGEFNLNSYIAKAQNSDSTIKNKQASIDLNKTNIDYYYYKNVDWTTQQLKTGGATIESYERSIKSLNLEIDDRKKAISDTLTKSYTDILDAEKAYADKLKELETMKQEMERKQVQYDLGKITLNTLENYQLSIDKLEHEIAKAEYDHELMVMKFTNQNLAL